MSARLLCSMVLVAAVAFGACGGSNGSTTGERSGTPAAIDVVNIAYAPASLEIAAGDAVVWTNRDEGVRHTVTSGMPGDNGVPGVTEGKPSDPDGVFDGDLPDASASFGFTFDQAGTFPYFCEVHPSMTGEIVVR